MEILERPNGSRYGFASLANIGYNLFEVNLEGEVYKYGTHDKAERVRSNRWKLHTRDRSGRLIERVMRTNVLVGCAWCNVDEKVWENSTYADTIRRCKEFFSIPNGDIRKTDYQTKNGFSYYVTRYGEVWNTETMTKVKGSINGRGYRYVALGSVNRVTMHRLVAHHFVPKPKDLVDQRIPEENLEVKHIDGNKLNNRSDNLEWVTHAGNMEHASINGLLHTTIDDQLLERVWQYLQEGYSDTNISKETGISVSTVNRIRKGVYRRYRTDKYTWSNRSPIATTIDDQLLERVWQLLQEGYTDTAISRETGISDRTVNTIRHRRSLRYITDKYTWPKSSIDARMKERRELAMKCVKLFNQGMSYQAIADKLGFNSVVTVGTLIGKYRDLITRKLPPRQDQRTKLDKTTIFSIYDDFMYTDMKNYEITRKYNVSCSLISRLRAGHRHSNLAREYITSKGLDRYWQGYRPLK